MRFNEGPADDTEAEWTGRFQLQLHRWGRGGVIGQGAGGIPMISAAC